jgi:hypothetical protein
MHMEDLKPRANRGLLIITGFVSPDIASGRIAQKSPLLVVT